MTEPNQLPEALSLPISRNVQLLLDSRIPARLAWVATDGHPRVVPIWFHWNGSELAMSTFTGARKLDAISSGTVVAVSIDTQEFPYRSLLLRGPVELELVDGLADDYRRAADRYLGPDAAAEWCDALNGRPQVVVRMNPTWAVESDLSGIDFMQRRDTSNEAR